MTLCVVTHNLGKGEALAGLCTKKAETNERIDVVTKIRLLPTEAPPFRLRIGNRIHDDSHLQRFISGLKD